MTTTAGSMAALSFLRRCTRVGLRGEMALLGLSGILVTGAICAAALNYASMVQNESNRSGEFKAHVASLSQSFLESRQITDDFLRKPSEMLIAKQADSYERQLPDLSSVEAFVAALPDIDPLKRAVAHRPVIGSTQRVFTTLFRRSATSASTTMTAY